MIRVAIERMKYFVGYVHHRLRKPPCSLAQIPRCTLILSDVHRAFTPRSQHKGRDCTRLFPFGCLSPVFVSQRLDAPSMRLRHARATTDLSKWIPSRPHSTSRAYGSTSSVLAARSVFSRRPRSAASRARDSTANWRKSVLLSRCAKCAGRIVGRYYVPEMLVRSG